MVGRLRIAPSVIAILAAASPLTAQPAHPLLSPPVVRSLPSLAEPAAAIREMPELREPDEQAQPIDALGASPAPPAGAAAATSTPAVLSDAALGSGEYGIEYQLSFRDADSFLNRLTTRLKRLVEQAMTYLGTPYRLGGTSRRGLDCSGLVGAVYGEQGLGMPRTAAAQFAEGEAVAESELRPGDLVFFRDTYKRGISHVGIYIGDGRFIHAAGRRQGVIVSELSRSYYHLRYAGARRLAPQAGAAGSDKMAGLPGPLEPAASLASSAGAPSQSAVPVVRAAPAGTGITAAASGPGRR